MNINKKALGCTLVLTDNSLITIREDFSSPLKKVNLSKTEEVITVSLANDSTEDKFNVIHIFLKFVDQHLKNWFILGSN